MLNRAEVLAELVILVILKAGLISNEFGYLDEDNSKQNIESDASFLLVVHGKM